METTNSPTKVTDIGPDSGRLYRLLMEGTIEHQRQIIAAATWQLKKALSLPKTHGLRDMHLQLALKALGGLGAS